VGVLLGGGYMVFALGLAGLLVYLYRKDGDIQEMLSNCRWARYFTLALSVVGALMVYFSSLLLYTALAVVGIAFFVTAASYAEDIEFDKA
jgi:nicotinamide riboside transporter PnuC